MRCITIHAAVLCLLLLLRQGTAERRRHLSNVNGASLTFADPGTNTFQWTCPPAAHKIRVQWQLLARAPSFAPVRIDFNGTVDVAREGTQLVLPELTTVETPNQTWTVHGCPLLVHNSRRLSVQFAVVATYTSDLCPENATQTLRTSSGEGVALLVVGKLWKNNLANALDSSTYKKLQRAYVKAGVWSGRGSAFTLAVLNMPIFFVLYRLRYFEDHFQANTLILYVVWGSYLTADISRLIDLSHHGASCAPLHNASLPANANTMTPPAWADTLVLVLRLITSIMGMGLVAAFNMDGKRFSLIDFCGFFMVTVIIFSVAQECGFAGKWLAPISLAYLALLSLAPPMPRWWCLDQLPPLPTPRSDGGRTSEPPPPMYPSPIAPPSYLATVV